MCAQLIYPAQNGACRPPLVRFFCSILFWLHEYDYITKGRSSPVLLPRRGVAAHRQEPTRFALQAEFVEDLARMITSACFRPPSNRRCEASPGIFIAASRPALQKQPKNTSRTLFTRLVAALDLRAWIVAPPAASTRSARLGGATPIPETPAAGACARYHLCISGVAFAYGLDPGLLTLTLGIYTLSVDVLLSVTELGGTHMQKAEKIDFTRLLGFAAASGQSSNGVNFQSDIFEARLGAKVGAEVLVALDVAANRHEAKDK